MDEVHKYISDMTTLRSFNRFLIYLEVLTLEDMTTGDGIRFRDNIIHVEKSREEKSKFE